MLNTAMFCGSFSHEYDDDPWSLGSSPRRSRRREKNPYSNRGLDKFSKVLADLEGRRENIMSQIGDVSLIRFMYSNSHDWIPIIVKLRDQKPVKTQIADSKDRPMHGNSEAVEKSTTGLVSTKEGRQQPAQASDGKMKKSFSWSLNNGGRLSSRWRSSYYWPMALIFILLCLVMFGRSFAILCTSVWWYLVPILKGGDGNVRRSMKKDYLRRLSEKKLGGDVKSVATKMGAFNAEGSSPRAHVNGKK